MSRNSVLEGSSSGVQAIRETQEHILDVALRLMQMGGYHAFSYADVAAEVGITKASVHYHYPAKADLGRATLRYYRSWWQEQMRGLTAAPRRTPRGISGADTPGVDKSRAGVPETGKSEAEAREPSAEARLRGYSRVYRDILRSGRVCLVFALAPESLLLPESMQAELRDFYAEHQDWLVGVLQEGRETGTFTAPGPLHVQAQALISALHGAQGLARVQGDVYRYCAVAHLTLSGLGLPFTDLEISDPATFEAQSRETQNRETQSPAPELSEPGLAFA